VADGLGFSNLPGHIRASQPIGKTGFNHSDAHLSAGTRNPFSYRPSAITETIYRISLGLMSMDLSISHTICEAPLRRRSTLILIPGAEGKACAKLPGCGPR
jgi:hypothetical protein